MKHPIAQTNLQLYNQLIAAGYSDEDFATVRNAYEYGIELFTGRIAASRKVFLEHGVGSASVLVQIGEPAMMVAAGMLHNIFWNGVWEHGVRGITEKKRAEVRRRLGDDIMPCLEQFHTLRWNEETVADLLANFDELDQAMYQTILLRLADHIDHLADAGLAYSTDAAAKVQRAQIMLEPMVGLAQKLGHPELGDEMRALTALSANMKVPSALQGKGQQRLSTVTAPRTHRLSPIARVRQTLWRGFGIRKAMRSLFTSEKTR